MIFAFFAFFFLPHAFAFHFRFLILFDVSIMLSFFFSYFAFDYYAFIFFAVLRHADYYFDFIRYFFIFALLMLMFDLMMPFSYVLIDLFSLMPSSIHFVILRFC